MKQTRTQLVGGGVRRADHYTALLDEQERSGLSVRAFAEARGLAPLNLYVWRRKLGRARRRGAGVRSGPVAVDVFEHRRMSAASSEGFEVLLANGSRVRIPLDFDAARVAELVAVLRTC